MHPTDTRRLKLRPSILYGTTETSVFVQSPRGAFTLNLPAPLIDPVAAWLEALQRPATEQELLAAAGGPKAAPALEKVLRHLRGHGVLLDLPAQPAPEHVPAAAVAYAESHCPGDPYAALHRLARTTVTLRGEADLVRAAADALAGRGIAHTTESHTTEGDGDRAGLTVRDAAGRLAVELRYAGERLWVASSDLGADPQAVAELERRLAVPGRPRPAARRLAAGLAAEQAFRELLELTEASGTVHVVDSAPLGWRSRRIERAAGPVEDVLDALDEHAHPGADDLVGRYRWDTPDDWQQIPLALARVVPGPGTGAVERTPAAGWGVIRNEAKARALAAFLRGDAPRRGAGVTLQAAVVDAALREAARRLLDAPDTPWHEDAPVPVVAADVTGPACRTYRGPAGLVLAEAAGEHGRAAAWATDAATALDHAACAYLALRQGADGNGVVLDTTGAAGVTATADEAYALARTLLGAPVAFHPDAEDVLTGHAPLVAGDLAVQEARA
ncbi:MULTISPECIES: hypothetical protein [Streptomyces]|uniref:Uncharacterized protein n=1 Tax=Streptomyces luteosporeus TaxID=173856 RepID=A0ABP6G5L1_9ACTN